jgi:alcohol dehydrogenase
MRALKRDGSEIALDRSCPVPAPREGEALIHLRRAAVSATDLAVSHGLFSHRGVLGHQFVGVVESIKASSASNLIGKRVVASIVTSCGKCDLCQGGLGAHCRNRLLLGMHNKDGCFSDRFTLPVKQLVEAPDSLDDDHAVFAVEVAAALQAAGQLTIVGKPYITVLGDGSLGLLMAQVMAKLNASVRVIGRHPEQLAICEKWGVKHRHVDDIGRRADQDIVVDCTGTADGLSLAMHLVRPRGKILLKSLHSPSTPKVDLSPLVIHEIELIGSFAGPVKEAVAAIARGEVEVLSLISKRMSLSDGPAILKTAAQPGMIKVLVDP